LTHIFVDDGGVFGANLIGAGLPFAFLPAVPAVNDAVYFGVATAALDSGPFCSLVLDILAAQAQVTTITWQYWNGAWVALTVRDNTNANGAMTGDPFDTTGINSVHWNQPADWATTTINGVLGYWVRALVGVVGGVPTPPTQANRDIYTIVTPYVDTLASQTKGDIPALALMKAEGQSGDATMLLRQQTLYMGLRSYSRGSNFSSFINLSDEQNQAGIVVTLNAAAACTFATDITSPTGRITNWSTGGAAAETWLAYVTIPTTLVDDYTGIFRALLRIFMVSVNSFILRLRVAVGEYTNVVWQSDEIYPTPGAFFQTVDFRSVTLPPLLNDLGNTYKNVILRIDGAALAAVDSDTSYQRVAADRGSRCQAHHPRAAPTAGPLTRNRRCTPAPR